MIAAALAIFQLTPRYTARTTVMIDPKQQQVVDIQSVVSGLSGDPFTVESQVQVIAARSVAEKVINDLNLLTLPEFKPELEVGKGGLKNFGRSEDPTAELQTRISIVY